MICTITAAKRGLTAADAWPSSPSSDWWISPVLFQMQEQAAADQDQVAARDLLIDDVTVKSGAVRPMIQDRISSRPMRMNIARNRPIVRAVPAALGGQLVDQDRDEDDVVDAEHELERGQRQQGDPGLRVGQQFDHRRQGGEGAVRSRTEAVRGHSRRAQAKRANTWSSRTVIAARASAATKLASKLLRASG